MKARREEEATDLHNNNNNNNNTNNTDEKIVPSWQCWDPNNEDHRRQYIVGDYKPGSIRRIKLHNFLTYRDVEFCPGPR
jgi:hypothetical protein